MTLFSSPTPATRLFNGINNSKRRKCIFVGLALVCCLFTSAARAISVDYTQYLHWTGLVSGDGQGTYRDATIDGDRLYAACFDGGIQIISISDPAQPFVMGEFATSGDAVEIAVSWPYAYVAVSDGGLQVVDVSDPGDPQLYGIGDMPSSAQGVVVDGDRAFVACADSGLVVVDIGDPAAPVVVERVDTPGSAVKVVLVGDHLAVADGIGGVQILSRSPYEIVEAVQTPGMALSVAVSGDHLYVADYVAGLTVIDISTITDAEVVASIVSAPGVFDVTVADGVAVLANSYAGIVTMDVSDPTSPARISGLSSSSVAYGVVLSGGNAYLSDGVDLHVYALGNADTPPILDYLSLNTPIAVAADRHFLYSIDHSRLWVVSTGSGEAAGVGSTLYNPHDICLLDPYVYIADHTAGLRVGDVSDSAYPELDVGIYLGGDAWAVALQDTHVYVAVDGLGLVVLSMEEDPGAPTITGFCATTGHPRDVAVQDDVAFVATGEGGLFTVDVSDPADPVVLDNLITSMPVHHVAVNGDYAFGTDDDYFIVYDVADPRNIGLVTSLHLRGPLRDLEVVDDFVYVVDPYIGLYVIDIAAPAHPTVVGGGIESSFFVSSVAHFFDRLYVVDGNGVFLMPIHGIPTAVDETPRIPPGLIVSPNPFNPSTTIAFSLAAPGDVRVDVYDLLGRLVTVLADRRFPAGDHALQWDGRDTAGRAQPTGVYLARMKSMDGVRSEKMTLVR